MQFAQLKIGQLFEFAEPQSRLEAFFTANARADEFHYKDRQTGQLHRVDDLSSEVYTVDINTPLTHEDLLAYGLEWVKADDEHGETRSGYWVPGDGNGKGYGEFFGETVEAAVQAIVG